MGRDIIIEEEGIGRIVLYQTPDGQTNLEVKLENDTVWLTRQQMALLFGRDVKTIGKHINNALKEELAGELVVAKFATPKKYGRREGFEQTQYPEYYSLEMITSVGFRVKSKNGVVFRRWANTVLKEYLIKGYAVKNNLIQERYDELKALVDTIGRTMLRLETGAEDQVRSIFDVVRDYTYALDTLDGYDYQSLEIRNTSGGETFHATYENAMEVIDGLKEKFGESSLFANEKDESFRSSIGQIYQTWDGKDLYPSVEEKAAALLYLVTKNHSFTDGNKRIAATLFLWFMENNGILYAADGSKRIADNALVALTLMIAESKTEEMDMMVKVVVNLINTSNK
ncbi:MAG: virulence protein RhuM/Fic/DOC family protein [Bacteroidales bacterium]|nr:virulence protein RhuM/Fic/DOC family protein [Candidatus Cacconaster equi]